MSLVRKPVLVLGPALLVVVFALATNVVPFRQILEQRRQVASAQATLQRLDAENALLADEVAALHTPEEIERLAREELGYARPGETAYVVVDPSTSHVRYPEDGLSTGPGVRAERRPWYRRIWDYLTGRDLVSPGG